MNKIVKLLKTKFFRNGIYLYILQFFNLVIPLITLPYIMRILNPIQYGIFSKSLNLVSYFQVIVNYGFNFTGVKKLVSVKDNKDETNLIYSRILTCKIMLLSISLITINLITFASKMPLLQYKCVIILCIIILGETLQQTWIFQGLQDLKFLTIINVIARIISLILIFMFIKNENQIILYSIFYSVTYMLIGIGSNVILRYKYKIKYIRIKLCTVVQELKDGWYLFLTSFSSKLFTAFGITVLSIISSDHNIGVYSAIQKIPSIIIMCYSPIGQIIYPYNCELYKDNKDTFIKINKLLLKIIIFANIFIMLFCSLFKNIIVSIILGEKYVEYSALIIPLVFWMAFSIINNILGIQLLVSSGYQKEYSYCFNISIVIMLLLNTILGYYFDIFGISIASLLSEILLSILCIIKLKKCKILKNIVVS